MKLSIDAKSSAALREFSEAMPMAIGNITESSETLNRVLQSVADTVGVHYPEFQEMFLHIKKAQEDAADAVLKLPPLLVSTADKMDKFISAHPTISD